MIGAELHVPLPTQLQTQSTAQRRLAAGRATAAHALLSGAAQAGRRCARALQRSAVNASSPPRAGRGQRSSVTRSPPRWVGALEVTSVATSPFGNGDGKSVV